jgi:cytochrome d ubiquinol oxidase subunit II
MTAADLLLVLTFAGLTAYALFGGADFGAGFWDLIGSRGEDGTAQRGLIDDVIGPVWEANHVWLIFAIVVVWTAFPPVFAAVASTLYIPLTLAAFGIILRGSGFAFRKATHGQRGEGLFGRIFGVSSVLTPFFLGTIAGAVASGRVPPGNAAGDVVGSWLNPASLLGGILAVGLCAYLAAVYLTADARRRGQEAIAEAFRRRALASGIVVGVVALLGIVILSFDAPRLAGGLGGRGLPLVIASALGGLTSLVLLWTRRFTLARGAAALAVGSVLWGWAVAQYPELLVGHLNVTDAAASETTLVVLLTCLLVGAVLVIPSLLLLYYLFQHSSDAMPVSAAQDRHRVGTEERE